MSWVRTVGRVVAVEGERLETETCWKTGGGAAAPDWLMVGNTAKSWSGLAKD